MIIYYNGDANVVITIVIIIRLKTVLSFQDKRTNAPYVSSQFTFELRGSGARKVRYNLLRKKLETPGHVTS